MQAYNCSIHKHTYIHTYIHTQVFEEVKESGYEVQTLFKYYKEGDPSKPGSMPMSVFDQVRIGMYMYVCMCVCVCVHACMYACLCVCAYVDEYKEGDPSKPGSMPMSVLDQVRVATCVFVCVRTYTHVCLCVCMYIYICEQTWLNALLVCLFTLKGTHKGYSP